MNIGDGQLEGASAPLGGRYSIVRVLNSSAPGPAENQTESQTEDPTYLAKDGDRDGALCVLKSFLPAVQEASTLEEAKSLFEQEADVLYQLDHPQIPKFRQLLEVPALSGAGGQLFWVQDYVQGPTYQSLLNDRQQVGGRFHEVEINQLLYQLLPVLSYLHSQGLVHRDICPDNIVLSQTNGLPMLIDFGSVKALTASVRSRLGMEGVAKIGKAGYTPPDQVGASHADQTSDLYGLAATLLVLATGETPQQLHNKAQGTWRGYETLSPKLGYVLLKMLSPAPEQRFPNADAILAVLSAEDTGADTYSDATTAFHDVGDTATLYDGAVPVGLAGGVGAAAGAIAAGMSQPTGDEGFSAEGYSDGYSETSLMNAGIVASTSSNSAAGAAETYEPELDGDERMSAKTGDRQALFGLLALLGLTGLLLLLAIPRLGGFPFGNRTADAPEQGRENSVDAIADGEFSPEEQARKGEINSRRTDLGLSDETFTAMVNQLFYQEYPALLTSGPEGGQKFLTPAAADEPLRIRWDNIALELLNTLESNFSAQSRSAIGTYSENSRAQWRSLIAPTGITDRALTDLVDAKFFRLFPDQSGRDFLSQPIGQLYYALADDLARGIDTGTVTESIRFNEGAFSQDVRAQLEAGAGRLYTLSLSDGQLLRLNLNAPSDSTLLSLYPPTPTDSNPALFSDSAQTTWSGALNETGTYTVVVVNRSSGQIDYTLATAVDNVRSTPAPSDEPSGGTDAGEDSAEAEIDLDNLPDTPLREEPTSDATAEPDQ